MRRFLKLVSVILMVSFILTACGSRGWSINKTSSQTSSTKEMITLSFFTEGAPGVNELKLKEIKKLFNIKLNTISTPTQEYDQKLNLAMASGDVPDIILFRNISDMFSYSKQGALLQLDDLLKKSGSNTMTYIPEKLWPYVKVDGKIYTIPTDRIPQKNNVYIRKDWLDKLGLKIPVTLDEYYNVMKAFVNNDPDGNQKRDTYGYGSSATGNLAVTGTFSPIYGAFGVMDGGWYWDKASDKLLPYDIHPEMKEALSYIHKLYNEGLVLQDWLAIKGVQADAYIDSGKLGLFYGFWTYGANRELKIKEATPDAEIIPIAPPVGPAGLSGNRSSGYVGTRSYSISAKTKYPEKAMEFLDYFYSTDGFMQGRYGVEGIHWSWKSGAGTPKKLDELNKRVDDIQFTDQYNKDNAAVTIEFLNLFQPQQDITLLPGWSKAHIAAQKFTRNQPIIADASDGVLSDVKTKYSAVLNTLRDETYTKIIMGEYPVSKFDEFVTKWKAQGGDELIKDMTEKYKSLSSK